MFGYKYDGFINSETLSTAKEVEEVEVRPALEEDGYLRYDCGHS